MATSNPVAISFLIGLVYLIYKFILWFQFKLGSAPLVIGLFFLSIIGKYIGANHTQVMHRPLIMKKERINF